MDRRLKRVRNIRGCTEGWIKKRKGQLRKIGQRDGLGWSLTLNKMVCKEKKKSQPLR